MTEAPIFICGLPRTGKTALRIALSAHPRLSLTRKTRMWITHFDRYGSLSDDASLDACLQGMLSDPAVAKLLPDEAAIRREYPQTQRTYADLFGLIHSQYARRLGKSRWGEQMAGLEDYVDAIFETWPDARMIHMVRHPAKWIDAGAQTRPGGVGKSLAKWRASAQRAVQGKADRPNAYLVVRMETMLAQPAAALQEVAEFVGESITFEIGNVLVDAMPSRAAAPSLGRAARRYVTQRTRDLTAALGYVEPEAEGADSRELGVAALWFGLGDRSEATVSS